MIHLLNSIIVRTIVESMLQYSIPWNLCVSVIYQLLIQTSISNTVIFNNTKNCNNSQCYFTKSSHYILDWSPVYRDDINTLLIITIIANKSAEGLKTIPLINIDGAYHDSIRQNCIHLLHDKLIFQTLIFRDKRYIGFIIVPVSLQQNRIQPLS